MSVPPYMSSRSPPPLQHPKPTHPAYPPPEPPHTPVGSAHSSPYSAAQRISQDGGGGGYVRYSSPPVNDVHGVSFGGAEASASASGAGGFHQGGGAHPRAGYAGGTPAQGGAGPMGSMGGNMGNMGAAGVGGYQNMGFASWPGMNDATAQMGVQFGKSAVAAGQDYVEKNFSRYLPLPLVKTSFSVTNSYVLRKLRLVLFPWRHKPWARQAKRSGDSGAMEGWMPPREDINAPDLYIPTMALVTYTLLSAFASGLQSRFHPEVLGVSLSKSLAVVIVEFLAIKLGCYFLDVQGGGASGVELIGYGGYKFVGIIATVLVSLLKFGSIATTAVFVYTFGANAFFLLRSLKYVLLPDPSTAMTATSQTLSHGQRSRRVQFLFIVAMTQFLWMGVLSRV